MQDPVNPEYVDFESVKMAVQTDEFRGYLIDWALAMAHPKIKVFNMHDGSYPGNYNKLQYAMDNPTVIVDLEWKIWFEEAEKSCQYNPHENWEFLGPFLTAEKPCIRYDFESKVYSVYFDNNVDGSYLVCHEKLETAIAKAFILFKFGSTMMVPYPLAKRYLQQ